MFRKPNPQLRAAKAIPKAVKAFQAVPEEYRSAVFRAVEELTGGNRELPTRVREERIRGLEATFTTPKVRPLVHPMNDIETAGGMPVNPNNGKERA